MAENRAVSPKPEMSAAETDDICTECLCPPQPGPITRSTAKKNTRLTSTQPRSDDTETINTSTLFQFIKPFDGSREKLQSFISNCDNAISLANENQKIILFKYIQSQLEGKAEIAVSIKEFQTWPQLSDFLQTQFGEKKHYTHMLAELQECRQMPNEAAHQYSLRIETCLSKLLTEVSLTSKSKRELPGRIAAMEDLALHTFLLGLKPNISNIVRCRDPQTLNEAINSAISEEKIQNMLYQRKPSSHFTTNSQSPRHTPSTSRQTDRNQYNRPTQHTYNKAQSLFCRYCKNQGHTIEICRKREYINRFGNNQNRPNFRNNQQTHFLNYAPNDGQQQSEQPLESYDTVDSDSKNE